jgi:hypothetical protein
MGFRAQTHGLMYFDCWLPLGRAVMDYGRNIAIAFFTVSVGLLGVSGCSDDDKDDGKEGTVSTNTAPAPSPTAHPKWSRVGYAQAADFATNDCLNPGSYSISIRSTGDYEVLNLDENCNNSWFGRLEGEELQSLHDRAIAAASYDRSEKNCEGGHQFNAPVTLVLLPAGRGKDRIMEGAGENFCWRGARSAVEDLTDTVTSIAEKIINRP